jgi:hypothetical protein
MTGEEIYPMTGSCDCGGVRYELTREPLVVHCCHCRWCQRESGSAFALNAMVESEYVVVTHGEPEIVLTPSASGKGQRIARCPTCRIALWSHYAGGGDAVRFVRVGTLADPDAFPPDIHIFTSTRQPWVMLPPGARAVPEYYDAKVVWSAESLERREVLRAKRQRQQQQ